MNDNAIVLEQVWQMACARFSAGELSRFRASIDALAGRRTLNFSHQQQRPRDYYFPGIEPTPFVEPERYPATANIAHVLESHAEEIRDEFELSRASLNEYASSKLFPDMQPGDWTSIGIWRRGNFECSAREFPKTAKVVSLIERDLFPFRGQVTFLCLGPGARIPPHHDWTNAQLTCHLCIHSSVDCGIRVADETRFWANGKVLFFDHSFSHSAWNDGTEPRVVLLLNLVHPELSTAERFAVALLTRVFFQGGRLDEKKPESLPRHP